jgi:hypothetical protein
MTRRPFGLVTSLSDKAIAVSGYPGAFRGQQVYSPGTVDFDEQFTASSELGNLSRTTGSNQFVHTADTLVGHSGSPIWEVVTTKRGKVRWRLLGLDTLGFNREVFPSIFASTGNIEGGIAWIGPVVRDIRAWMAKPGWR